MTDHSLQLPTHNMDYVCKGIGCCPDDTGREFWLPSTAGLGDQVGLRRFRDSDAMEYDMERPTTRITSALGRSSNDGPSSPISSARMSRHGSAPINNPRPRIEVVNQHTTRYSPSSGRSSTANQYVAFGMLTDQQLLGCYPDPTSLLPTTMEEIGGGPIVSSSSEDTVSPLLQQFEFNRLNMQSSDRQNRLTNLLDDGFSYSTPTTGELTMDSSLTNEMSRQTSTVSNFTEVDFRFQYLEPDVSTFSYFCFSGELSPHVLDTSFELANGMPIGSSDVAKFHSPVYPAGVLDDAFLFPTFPNVHLSNFSEGDSDNTMSETSHSLPNENILSSDQTRFLRRRQEQIVRGARLLAPKESGNEAAPSRSDGEVITIRAEDGNPKRVAAIPKAPYVRPVYPRKTCVHCNDHPEGFRGEHELRRHIERAHNVYKKVWVTVDASESGDFLSNCKSCRKGKQYGVYYNAAAHLRRAHFHPCKRGRGKGKGDEGRGGKAGGNHPPMEELKSTWMKEIEIDTTGRSRSSFSDDDDFGSNDSPSSTETTQRSHKDFTFPIEDSGVQCHPRDLSMSVYGDQAEQHSNESDFHYSANETDPADMAAWDFEYYDNGRGRRLSLESSNNFPDAARHGSKQPHHLDSPYQYRMQH